MNRPVRILLNLTPLLLGACLFFLGGWGIAAIMVLQAVLAFLNCRCGQGVVETLLLNLLMGLAALAGGFVSVVLYGLFVSGADSEIMALSMLLAADLFYSLLLLLTSTLWSGVRRAKGGAKRALRILAALALGGLVGCACIAVTSLTGYRPKFFVALGRLSPPMLLVTLLVSMAASLLFHELGHLVFGLAAGYRFHSFRLGPVVLSRENGRLVLRVLSVAGIGGACGLLPPLQGCSKAGRLSFLAGGVLSNTLTALLALLLPLTGGAKAAAWVFAFLSLAGAVVNALPWYAAGNPTDGRQFWALLLGTAEGERMSAYLRQTQQLMAGVRPRELDPLPPLPETPKGEDYRARVAGAYFRCLDGGDLAGAGEALAFLEANIEAFPSIALSALYYELCCFACIQGELDRAVEFRAKAQPGLDRDGDLNGLRVRAYCAWYLDRDAARAKDLCEQALAVERQFPIPGQARMEHDLVTGLLAELSQEISR